METWEASMPEQIDDVLDTGKVHCLIGDITEPELGLKRGILEKLQQEVTLVIHAAASISVLQDLSASVRNICLPTIFLAHMLADMSRLRMFLYVSSVAVNTFLPGCLVTESIHPVDNLEEAPDVQIRSILETCHSPYAHRFPVPYAQEKYLSERLILSGSYSFPVLVVRPSSLAPAIRAPFQLYGQDNAMPGHSFLHLLLQSKACRSIEYPQRFSQDRVMDEIPVDQAANVCLLHAACGTTGIIHAGSQLHVINFTEPAR